MPKADLRPQPPTSHSPSHTAQDSGSHRHRHCQWCHRTLCSWCCSRLIRSTRSHLAPLHFLHLRPQIILIHGDAILPVLDEEQRIQLLLFQLLISGKESVNNAPKQWNGLLPCCHVVLRLCLRPLVFGCDFMLLLCLCRCLKLVSVGHHCSGHHTSI